MLTIHGAGEVQELLSQYHLLFGEGGANGLGGGSPPDARDGNSGLGEPPVMRGHLWKAGRRAARYFETTEGTPLVLYWRSRTLANSAYPPHACLDLLQASKIALITTNGIPTSKFVIQATSKSDDSMVEHFQLQASTVDDAKLWVEALTQRKAHFDAKYAALKSMAHSRASGASRTAAMGPANGSLAGGGIGRPPQLMRQPSRDELVKSAMALLQQASEMDDASSTSTPTPGVGNLGGGGSGGVMVGNNGKQLEKRHSKFRKALAARKKSSKSGPGGGGGGGDGGSASQGAGTVGYHRDAMVGKMDGEDDHLEFYSASSSSEEAEEEDDDAADRRREAELVKGLQAFRTAASASSTHGGPNMGGPRRSSNLPLYSAEDDLQRRAAELVNNPTPVFPHTMWSQPSYDDIPLRGYNYLNDHVKVKAVRSLMNLTLAETLSHAAKRVDHIASIPSTRLARARRAGRAPPFTWILNYQVPGAPLNYSFLLYLTPATAEIAKLFVGPRAEAERVAAKLSLPPGFLDLLRDYFTGESDEFRNQRFKMIPQIKEGPWLVRNSVPSKPALIGTKLKTRYFRGPDYLEQDLDIASTALVEKLTRMSVGFSTKLVVDMAYTLEGRSSEELPEEIIGIARVIHADLSRCERLDGL